MAAVAVLPTYSQPVVGSNGLATPAFYRFFAALGDASTQASGLQSQIDTINQEISSLDSGFQVRGIESIVQSGASVPGGVVMLSLMGDVGTTGNTQYYGSDQTGNKGWYAVSSALAGSSNISLSTAANGVTTFDLADVADSGAGSLLAITRDSKGRITGTRAATITGTANQIDVANGDGSAGAPTISLDVAVLNQLAALIGSPGLGYIDGLKMVWNSATSLSVTSGAAYIPSLGHVLQSAALLTLSSLVLTASTWYHIYLYNNSGTPAIECVTTAPASPYNGNARAKTGDTSRRYIGSVLTDSTGKVINFYHNSNNNKLMYLSGVGIAPFNVLSNGTSTSLTTVNLSSTIPITARFAAIFSENTATNQTLVISNSSVSGGDALYYVRPVDQAVNAEIPTDSSQSIQYQYGGAPTGGGAYVYVAGYQFER